VNKQSKLDIRKYLLPWGLIEWNMFVTEMQEVPRGYAWFRQLIGILSQAACHFFFFVNDVVTL